MPSKQVIVRCNRPFVHEQMKSPAAQEALARSSRSIGSYFENRWSTNKGTGLSYEEIKLILPLLNNVHPEDLKFREEVNRFFTDIHTVVPYVEGLKLEIGLSSDNSAPISDSNMPLKAIDFVRYRHSKGHPFVASSHLEAKGNGTVQFYIEDPEAVEKERMDMSEIADTAMILYQQIKADKAKVKMGLTLMQEFIKKKTPGEMIFIPKMSEEERQLRLREIAVSQPGRFTKVMTNEDLKFMYQSSELIRVGLLKRAGTSIIVTESGDTLGETLEDAVATLFKDPSRAQLVSSLKGQMLDRLNRE